MYAGYETIITFDAARAKTYETLRRGGTWKELIAAMKFLSNKNGTKRLRSFGMVAMREVHQGPVTPRRGKGLSRSGREKSSGRKEHDIFRRGEHGMCFLVFDKAEEEVEDLA